MEEMEEILKKSKKERMDVPIRFTNCIRSSFKEQENRKIQRKLMGTKRRVLAVSLGLILTMGATVTATTIQYIYRLKGINDQGIQTAIQNEYIQNINMDYVIKDGLKFKVDYLMMDDIHFDLVFHFVTKDKAEDYDNIGFTDLCIKDEEGNQIYTDSEDQKVWTKNKALGSSEWDIIEKKEHDLRAVLHLMSNDFPKSKKITVSFQKAYLYRGGHTPETIEYEDQYELEFDVADQLIQRRTVEYKSEDTRIKNIKLTNSGLIMSIETDKEIHEKPDENNISVMSEKENVYPLVEMQRVLNSEMRDYSKNQYIMSFSMTSYEQTDKIIVDLLGEKIELTKK